MTIPDEASRGHAMLEQFGQLVRDKARALEEQIALGELTPRLAALLLQRYADGIFDAAGKVLGSSTAAMPLQDVLEVEVAKLDSLWREHRRAFWNARPCDLLIDRRIGIPRIDRGMTRSRRLNRQG